MPAASTGKRSASGAMPNKRMLAAPVHISKGGLLSMNRSRKTGVIQWPVRTILAAAWP